MVDELNKYFGNATKPGFCGLSWSDSVAERWSGLNKVKSRDELGLLSWNVNGRLELRGCRESLLRRWALKGFVDVGLIQEHFKKDDSPLFDLFGPEWWNISSGAVGNTRGRKSGGCAIYGQPCLSSGVGFRHEGGRLCGFFTSGGVIMNIYFPTRDQRQPIDVYRNRFRSFVDEVIEVVERTIKKQEVSWMICGTDLNSHFAGTGYPPRRRDDYAASRIRMFMKRFNLISLVEELCPTKFTFLNSRGGVSTVDTFLISRWLYRNGRVSVFEVVDFIEHGSDHCPLYLRVKVFPTWHRRIKKPVRRILKSSKFESLRKTLEGGGKGRSGMISKVLRFFSHAALDWSSAVTKGDMNNLWCSWVRSYDLMVEKLVGTRPATDGTWGRKFSPEIRELCKDASVARSQFIKTRRDSCNYEESLVKWQSLRSAFIGAWERCEKDYQTECIEHAVGRGANAVWRLLNRNSSGSTRSLLTKENIVLTNPCEIVKELKKYHLQSTEDYKAVPTGDYRPLVWESHFCSSDLVLEITDELVAANVMKLKNSAVPDRILPRVIKLLFGSADSVRPLSEMIRAVVRTRIFPEEGKVARQTFLWKGVGSKGSLDNCRPITLANVILKLAESCVKDASKHYWALAGFPRHFWGHFFGAPESIYLWMSTVEAYLRTGRSPVTALTDVSQAFNRLNLNLYMRKLFDFGLPRQLIELVIDFISGMRVKLCWGKVQTDRLDRGNVGAPQGSLEGMWNFGVYADNIHSRISKHVEGISVGSEWVREVVYADDITPINPTSAETNLALRAVFEGGVFDAFKFKAKKCKIIGAGDSDSTIFYVGNEEIKRVKTGILLGAVINSTGIDTLAHVIRRAEMVENAVRQLKAWRTKGLPFDIVFKQLFLARVVPRFSYAFALFPYSKWGTTHEKIQKTLCKALRNVCGWPTPKSVCPSLATWLAICGFPPILSFLRQLKLEFAARLKLADHKSGRVFRALSKGDNGTFERNTRVALQEWVLTKSWNHLNDKTLLGFKRKVRRLAKKNWPHDLPRDGLHRWLFHNHSLYSGNVPAWAGWEWPESTKWRMGRFECHFYCLLTGVHPAFGRDGKCQRFECQGDNSGSLYKHHFFDCESSIGNRKFFKEKVLTLFEASSVKGLSLSTLNIILSKPSTWWIGLIDYKIFDLCFNIAQVHEFHRIVTIASVLSWGRFYKCPTIVEQSGLNG